MIVKFPDDEVVFFDEGALFAPDRIALVHAFGLLEHVVVENRLMRDDHVVAVRDGALQNVECGHHGHGYACHGRIGIAGLESGDGFLAPSNADVHLNGRNDFLRGRAHALRLGSRGERTHRECHKDRDCRHRAPQQHKSEDISKFGQQ